ncbi:MAG: aquaporin family protein [Flavobacteriales bacterium]|nr:aquaporin family protein [Flavobacteriales bacterium]
MKRELLGEFIGTAIIVFFGCGSVASAILFESFNGLFQIAMVWCIGVTLAIYASRQLSPAHLNPAVSLAMFLAKKINLKQLGLYSVAQFFGGVFGAAILFLLLGPTITHYELVHEIVRGTPESVTTSSMFGEFFPNPGFAEQQGVVSQWQAMGAELLGTFVLVFMIFCLCLPKNESKLTPFYIGLTVAGLICLLAPISQGGFNPARDFGPRVFSYFAGWKDAAFQAPSFSFLTVYILGPLVGGALAALAFRLTNSFRS